MCEHPLLVIDLIVYLMFRFFTSNFDAACFCFFNSLLLLAINDFNLFCVFTSAFSYAFNSKKQARFNGNHFSI